jgi:hypothetical protein
MGENGYPDSYQRRLKNYLNRWLLENNDFISDYERETIIKAADIVEKADLNGN